MATQDHSVLLRGEAGTGKQHAAHAIHHLSGRTGKFVIANLDAMSWADVSATPLESGSLGPAKLFETASGGTLLLDSIDGITGDVQTLLLALLSQQSSNSPTIAPAVRLIAATSRDLRKLVAEGMFRSDLYNRLCECELLLPPLRERIEDIPALFGQVIIKFNESATIRVKNHLRPETRVALEGQEWPGNLREFEAAIRMAATQTQNEILLPQDLPLASIAGPATHTGTVTAHVSPVSTIPALAKASFEHIHSIPQGQDRYDAYTRLEKHIIPAVTQLIIDSLLDYGKPDHQTTQESMPYYFFGDPKSSESSEGSDVLETKLRTARSFISRHSKWKTLRTKLQPA